MSYLRWIGVCEMKVENKTERVYLICDKENKGLVLQGIDILGRKVGMVAIFTKEDDALEVLYAVENQESSRRFKIVGFNPEIQVSVVK